jgi:hypothetical protein
MKEEFMKTNSVQWPLIVKPRSSEVAQEDMSIVLEIYKEYLKLISDWDKAASASDKFFSSVNLAILSGYIFVVKEKLDLPPLVLLAMLAASIWFAVMWILTNISYAQAVSIQYGVAEEIEDLLPIRPRKYAWEEKFKKVGYIRISHIQRVFPIIFIVVYIVLGISLLA